MILSKADATYDLTIELGVPIEMIVFESDVAVELLNVDPEKAHLSFEKPKLLVSLISNRLICNDKSYFLPGRTTITGHIRLSSTEFEATRCEDSHNRRAARHGGGLHSSATHAD